MFPNSQKKTKANDPFYDEKYQLTFDLWYTALCRYSYFLINNCEAAEDLVQDLFVHLWEHWERMKTIDSLKGYLFTSVKNRSINYLKQQSKIKFISPEDRAADLFFENELPSATEMMEKKELQQIVDKAIENLPARCRTIFILKRIDELSNKEISSQLGISIKTVEAQMTIALKRLYQAVSKHWKLFLLLLFIAAVNP